MTLATFQYTSDPGTVVLVSATAGRRIRVLRLLVACDSAGYVQLLSDPIGGGTAVSARLYVAAGRPMELVGARDGALAAAAGKALGLASVSTNPSAKIGLMLWYELVE